MEKNIFEKIRDREAPSDIVYRDEYVTAFKDIYPDAPVHILIIPNKKIKSLNEIEEEDSIYLSKIMLTANNLAKQFNIRNLTAEINNLNDTDDKGIAIVFKKGSKTFLI